MELIDGSTLTTVIVAGVVLVSGTWLLLVLGTVWSRDRSHTLLLRDRGHSLHWKKANALAKHPHRQGSVHPGTHLGEKSDESSDRAWRQLAGLS
jgi:hypothetical protein